MFAEVIPILEFRKCDSFSRYLIFDRSPVEAVQGIALSRDNRLPFAQI